MKDELVILKSFLGTENPLEKVKDSENYWSLIGARGKVIACDERDEERVLVQFDMNLDEMKLENHNPVKNSLWIKKTDLEIE